MANFGPQMIDSTDANGATTRGLFNIFKPIFGERSFDESNKVCKQRMVRAYLTKQVDIIAAATRRAGSSLRIRKRATRKSRERHA
jgi:hypothetical protein